MEQFEKFPLILVDDWESESIDWLFSKERELIGREFTGEWLHLNHWEEVIRSCR